jgi:hypothetical protein
MWASAGGSTPTSPPVITSGLSSSRRHSTCSVAFGKGVTTGEPGSVHRLILAVDDVEAAPRRSSRCGQRGVPPGRRPGPGARPAKSVVPDLRGVQRPGRQRVAAAGDHVAPPRTGVGGLGEDAAGAVDRPDT